MGKKTANAAANKAAAKVVRQSAADAAVFAEAEHRSLGGEVGSVQLCAGCDTNSNAAGVVWDQTVAVMCGTCTR